MIWLLLPESIDYLVRRKKTEQAIHILKQIDSNITYTTQTSISLHQANQTSSKTPVKRSIYRKSWSNHSFILGKCIYGT